MKKKISLALFSLKIKLLIKKRRNLVHEEENRVGSFLPLQWMSLETSLLWMFFYLANKLSLAVPSAVGRWQATGFLSH